MEPIFIYATSYFKHPWTWIKRLTEFLLAIGFLYWLSINEIDDLKPTEKGIKYFFIAILITYIFGRPQDELAFDRDHLFVIKKSILPFFNRTKKYNISEIRTIGCSGLFEKNSEFFGILDIGRNKNNVEIIFRDKSSKIIELSIYKKELNWIIIEIGKLIRQKSQSDINY